MATPASARSPENHHIRIQRPASTAIHGEGDFLRMLHLEQRRTERSRRPFVLMLIEPPASGDEGTTDRIIATLSVTTRETDFMGWYKEGCVIGTIFTEIAISDGLAVTDALYTRFNTALAEQLSPDELDQVAISLYTFPDDWESSAEEHGEASGLHADRSGNGKKNEGVLWIKRTIDIAGSLAALILISPLMLLVAAVIKLTSQGPVFFKQQRVGLYGRKFTFLKFRSMYVANNEAIHQAYIEKYISGSIEKPSSSKAIYKLTSDPRITPIGGFLRRTSLDELPQFLNVLRGDMALVGPRPPIPYEVKKYDLWHKRRFLSVKPGITGPWQVTGRSRTTFDEMVRIDLRYAKSWSLWLDIKILLKTPMAVLRGSGAC